MPAVREHITEALRGAQGAAAARGVPHRRSQRCDVVNYLARRLVEANGAIPAFQPAAPGGKQGTVPIVISKLALAWGLMALCVTIHATGVTLALRKVRTHAGRRPRAWRWVLLFIRIAGWIVLLHLLEIGAWAVVYVWDEAIPDLQSALLFQRGDLYDDGLR